MAWYLEHPGYKWSSKIGSLLLLCLFDVCIYITWIVLHCMSHKSSVCNSLDVFPPPPKTKSRWWTLIKAGLQRPTRLLPVVRIGWSTGWSTSVMTFTREEKRTSQGEGVYVCVNGQKRSWSGVIQVWTIQYVLLVMNKDTYKFPCFGIDIAPSDKKCRCVSCIKLSKGDGWCRAWFVCI